MTSGFEEKATAFGMQGAALMPNSVEKKEQELKKNMATVLKDKGMIQDTILELDRYKRDALKQTWEKVNV